VASASAFVPAPTFTRQGTAVFNDPNQPPVKGSGGMFDTRDPDAKVDEDPRKSIAEAPSFEEYMKARDAAAGK
jgi:hypothetical protein